MAQAPSRFQRLETMPVPDMSSIAIPSNDMAAEPVLERAQRKLRHANTVEESATGANLFKNEEYEAKIAKV